MRRGRNQEVLDEGLGDRFDGVLVSDFYAAYDRYPGVQQCCWTHLLREVHHLRAAHPGDAALAAWADAVHDLYLAAEQVATGARAWEERVAARAALERRLSALCAPH